MPRLIKAARVIKAEMPESGTMLENVKKLPFHEIPESHRFSYGFVENPITGQLLTEFYSDNDIESAYDDKSYMLTVRIDEKVIVDKLYRAEVRRRVAIAEKDNPGDIPEALTADIREQVIAEMLRTAPVETKIVPIIVNKGYVIICVSNDKLLSYSANALSTVLGSFTTQTTHINDQVYGLSGRLTRYVADQDLDAFDGFRLNGKLSLKVEGDEPSIISVNSNNLNRDLNPETFADKYSVNRISLAHDDCGFTLDKKFKFTSIWFDQPAVNESSNDVEDFINDAWLETTAFTNALDDLLQLFKRPDETEEDIFE